MPGEGYIGATLPASWWVHEHGPGLAISNIRDYLWQSGV